MSLSKHKVKNTFKPQIWICAHLMIRINRNSIVKIFQITSCLYAKFLHEISVFSLTDFKLKNESESETCIVCCFQHLFNFLHFFVIDSDVLTSAKPCFLSINCEGEKKTFFRKYEAFKTKYLILSRFFILTLVKYLAP